MKEMPINNEYLNNKNGVNPLFNPPKSEDVYVYTLMVYDNGNPEEKNIEKITKYIESITLGCAGGIIGNSCTRSIMFASNIAIPIVVKTLDLFTNVDYFIYEINNNHYKGSRNKSFITGNVEAIKYVNKK